MWVLQIIRCKQKVIKQNNKEPDLWSLYLYALKSPVTREKYQKRLERFFDFLGLEGSTVEEKSKVFMDVRGKDGNQWVFNSLLSFMQFNLARVDRKR
jgi:hypothetical protein